MELQISGMELQITTQGADMVKVDMIQENLYQP